MSETPLSSSPNDIIDLVDVENVQGDIIIGLPKRKQDFVFFVIEKAKHFKSTVSDLNITTTGDVQRAREKIKLAKKEEADCLIPVPGLNIAFTQKGLHALGIKDDLSDVPFSHGQLMDAKTLGDEGVETDKGFQPSWESAFTERIDGVLLVTGETSKTVHETLKTALNVLGSSIRVVHTVKGSTRPKELKGREHFGWEDGVSNPAVKNVGDKPLPGQRVIPAGTILLGKDQDPVEGRPAWATEGSFMVFRQLSQLVPEFHDFLHRNPIIHPGLSREEGSELLGARIVGRWKSGAPVELAPLKDDPILGKDKERNNDFVFSQEKLEAGQSKCPFSAHIRKMNPRNDLDFAKDDSVSKLSITRSGIAYGPEVMPSENEEKCTEYDRGLAFVCYQSSLQIGPVSRFETDRGFRFIQRFWANNTEFPPEKGFSPGKGPGIDPIIGQINGASRGTLGTNRGPQLTLPRDFVSSRGGEYFFSPSIRALKTVFSGIPVPDVFTTAAQPASTEPDLISHGYP